MSIDDLVHGYEAYVIDEPGPSVSVTGSPCGPDQPQMQATPPKLGEILQLTGTGPTNYLGLLVLSAAQTGAGIDLGQNCTAHVDPGSMVFLNVFATSSNNQWFSTLAVPNDAALLGPQLSTWAAFVPIQQQDPIQGTNGVLLAFGR
jgi:hypothetical protein